MSDRVIVTGGSRGLGLSIVRELVRDGWSVVTISRQLSDDLIALQRETADAIRTVTLDLADTAALGVELDRALDGEDIFGLVNNAAVGLAGMHVLARSRELESTLCVNLLAPIVLSRHVARRLIRRSGGRIVNITSVAAARSYRGLAAYTATKAGLEGFTRTLAVELAPRNITVNAVAPGFMSTDMTDPLSLGEQDRIVRATPRGRLTTTDEVARVVAFLFSSAAASITGQVIRVDGGISL